MQFSAHHEGFFTYHITTKFDSIPPLYLYPTIKRIAVGYDGDDTLL